MNLHLQSPAAACFVFALLVAATGCAAPNIANSSFEVDAVPAGVGYGPITDWSPTGVNVGINTSAGPFWDNGSITSGTKCAFIQEVHSIAQNVSGFEAGQDYDFKIRVNSRAATALQPRLRVTAGATVVIAPTQIPPVGGAAGTGNPFTLLTAIFSSPGAGAFPVTIENVEGSGDNTVLVDEVEIVPHIAAAKDWDQLH